MSQPMMSRRATIARLMGAGAMLSVTPPLRAAARVATGDAPILRLSDGVLTIEFDSARLRGMCPAERKAAIALLAGLLMEAAGVPGGRSGDDRV